MLNLNENKVYLSRGRLDYYRRQLKHLEEDVSKKLAIELASSPGSGMGRPLDLPIHDFARRFYAEIDKIRYKINHAIIIDDLDKPISPPKVFLGAIVLLRDESYDDEFSYLILGADETNPSQGIISYKSPLGRELLGKSEGDLVALPNGAQYCIEKIDYKPLDLEYQLTDWNKILSTLTSLKKEY